jgi:chromosome partitioning protein
MLNLNLWQRANGTATSGDDPTSPKTRRPLLKVAVLNTKGGCGKTTLSTSLAAYYALHGYNTALLDMDPQGSSLRWLANRGEHKPAILGLNGAEKHGRVTRSFQMRVPPEVERLVVDTPAAIDSLRLQDAIRGAHAVIIPVLPSDIDIHAASRCVAELLLNGRIENRQQRVAVVANRVKKQAQMYETLKRFLGSLEIPFVATFRDTQNYVHATEQGIGVHEIKDHNIREEKREWAPLIAWLESRPLASLQPAPAQLTGTGSST